MKRLHEYIIQEELDDNLFWKIDTYFSKNENELKTFNGLIDVCRANKSFNDKTIEAYLSGNKDFSNNLKGYIDFLEDTIHDNETINTDYTNKLCKVVKTIISNKTEGIKYTNIK